jgi:hypothetical protein
MRLRCLPAVIGAFLVLCSAFGASAGAMPRRSSSQLFKTPSGSIVCLAGLVGTGSPSLECGVRRGAKPAVRLPRTCQVGDPAGGRVRLSATGRPYGFCAGDPGVLVMQSDPGIRTLRYGSRLHAGPFTCTDEPAGLTCRNRSEHGFFLGRTRSRSF